MNRNKSPKPECEKRIEKKNIVVRSFGSAANMNKDLWILSMAFKRTFACFFVRSFFSSSFFVFILLFNFLPNFVALLFGFVSWCFSFFYNFYFLECNRIEQCNSMLLIVASSIHLFPFQQKKNTLTTLCIRLFFFSFSKWNRSFVHFGQCNFKWSFCLAITFDWAIFTCKWISFPFLFL